MGYGKRFGESRMKVGDLVKLVGSMWSSYGCREGQVGLVMETEMWTNRSGYPDAEFSRVWWSKDDQFKIYKTDHLEAVK